MNTCKQLNLDEYKQFLPQIQDGTIKSFPEETDCNDGCGVCCANVCDSCSFGSGNFTNYICSNGQTSSSPIQNCLGTYNPNNGTTAWVVGNWSYQVEYKVGQSPDSSTWQWNPGYPEPGANYRWIFEIHDYTEIQDKPPSWPNGYDLYTFAKLSSKRKYRLYSCQNGGAIEITDQAVGQAQPSYFVCYIRGGQVLTGTVLDLEYTSDGTKKIYPYTQPDCNNGMISRGWSGNQQPIPFNPSSIFPPPNNFLSCTRRECKEISKTDCEAAGGTWNAGLTCPEVNCT